MISNFEQMIEYQIPIFQDSQELGSSLFWEVIC